MEWCLETGKKLCAYAGCSLLDKYNFSAILG